MQYIYINSKVTARISTDFLGFCLEFEVELIAYLVQKWCRTLYLYHEFDYDAPTQYQTNSDYPHKTKSVYRPTKNKPFSPRTQITGNFDPHTEKKSISIDTLNPRQFRPAHQNKVNFPVQNLGWFRSPH